MLALLSADGEDVFKPYQFRMQEIEGLRYRSTVSVLHSHRVVCTFLMLVNSFALLLACQTITSPLCIFMTTKLSVCAVLSFRIHCEEIEQNVEEGKDALFSLGL